jgi:hypothetical protein
LGATHSICHPERAPKTAVLGATHSICHLEGTPKIADLGAAHSICHPERFPVKDLHLPLGGALEEAHVPVLGLCFNANAAGENKCRSFTGKRSG